MKQNIISSNQEINNCSNELRKECNFNMCSLATLKVEKTVVKASSWEKYGEISSNKSFKIFLAGQVAQHVSHNYFKSSCNSISEDPAHCIQTTSFLLQI